LVSHTKVRAWIEGVKNRELTRIIEPKRKEVGGDWRILHKEELRK